tara:strand:- start:441 stop:653 length:213 start_codon:yes stop_codon:yes gene_type:complete
MSKIGDYIIENGITFEQITNDRECLQECQLCDEEMRSSLLYYIEPASLCAKCHIRYRAALREKWEKYENT